MSIMGYGKKLITAPKDYPTSTKKAGGDLDAHSVKAQPAKHSAWTRIKALEIRGLRTRASPRPSDPSARSALNITEQKLGHRTVMTLNIWNIKCLILQHQNLHLQAGILAVMILLTHILMVKLLL